MGASAFWRRRRAVIVVGAVLLTLLGLLAGAVYTYISYRTAAAQLIVQGDRQVALLTAVRLRDELQKLARELEPAARSQSLYLGLTERQRLFLRGQSQRFSVFDGGVVLMDNTGRVRATVPERWEVMSSDWSNHEFFRKMLVAQPPSEYFSSVYDIGPGNAPVVVVSVPVLGQNDEMVGVLAGLFRLGESQVSALYASIVRLRLPGTGNTYLIDDNGRVIYDSGYERTGQTMDMTVLRAEAATENPTPRRDSEGNQVLASYAPIPGAPWTLVTETDWTMAIAPVDRFATGIFALLALGIVVPTLGVVLLARRQRRDVADDDADSIDARISKTMRKKLLPPYTPLLGGWEVAVHHQSAVNGASARDLYDYMLLPDGRLLISLATIADRGLSVVHLMTTARAAFRTAASRTQSAGQALSLCNNLLCPEVPPDAAVASLLALLDPMSGRLQLANAGYVAPFRWSQGDLIEMREGSDFLGQALDVAFDHDDIQLGPGDAMLFYSPGLLGIRPETGEPFGPERVRHVLSSSETSGAQAIVDALREEIKDFADAGSLRKVDITVLALSRAASAQSRSAARRSLRDELRALGETETDL